MSVPAEQTKRLYHSPWGLLDFQAEGVAYCYERLDNLAVWDTGIGKTHLAMASAALLFEDGLIDLCLIVAEKNKVGDDEWMGDLAKFTDLRVERYYGSPAKRAKIRKSLDTLYAPQVLVSTYETIRNDAAHYVEEMARNRKVKRLRPNVLTEVLRGKRVYVVWDEATKLGNRGSNNHKAHEMLIRELRQHGECRSLGLTATPVERGPENLYNLGRIMCPQYMPTVAQFEAEYIVSKDIFGNPVKWKNLDGLAERLSGVMLRKRKTDPDVIEQFPKKAEEAIYVPLGDKHLDFYNTVLDTFDGADEFEQRQLFVVMRQIAGHPASLIRSQSKIARTIVEAVGEAGLRALGSAKLDRLVEYLTPLVKGQGAQAVVFTFFGQSILPLIQHRLIDEGFEVVVNHGQMSSTQQTAARQKFRSGGAEVFLTSDAGSRGINLPEAMYCIQYELPLTFANFIQRADRIHRIDSRHTSITSTSLIALDTVEEGVASLVLRRNMWADVLLDDEDAGENFLSASDRRELLKRAKERTKAVTRS